MSTVISQPRSSRLNSKKDLGKYPLIRLVNYPPHQTRYRSPAFKSVGSSRCHYICLQATMLPGCQQPFWWWCWVVTPCVLISALSFKGTSGLSNTLKRTILDCLAGATPQSAMKDMGGQKWWEVASICPPSHCTLTPLSLILRGYNCPESQWRVEGNNGDMAAGWSFGFNCSGRLLFPVMIGPPEAVAELSPLLETCIYTGENCHLSFPLFDNWFSHWFIKPEFWHYFGPRQIPLYLYIFF